MFIQRYIQQFLAGGQVETLKGITLAWPFQWRPDRDKLAASGSVFARDPGTKGNHAGHWNCHSFLARQEV